MSSKCPFFLRICVKSSCSQVFSHFHYIYSSLFWALNSTVDQTAWALCFLWLLSGVRGTDRGSNSSPSGGSPGPEAAPECGQMGSGVWFSLSHACWPRLWASERLACPWRAVESGTPPLSSGGAAAGAGGQRCLWWSGGSVYWITGMLIPGAETTDPEVCVQGFNFFSKWNYVTCFMYNDNQVIYSVLSYEWEKLP